jgi:hypothetical protein
MLANESLRLQKSRSMMFSRSVASAKFVLVIRPEKGLTRWRLFARCLCIIARFRAEWMATMKAATTRTAVLIVGAAFYFEF